MTFSLLPGHGVVFVHLETAIADGDPNPLVSFASSALFCTGSRYVKQWWGVTGFQSAISGTTLSLDIILPGRRTTPFNSVLARITKRYLKPSADMDVTQIYAIVAGSLFAVLTTINFCIHLWAMFQTYAGWILRHIVYPFFLRRHLVVGPWSRRGFILRSIYILTNIFCSVYRTNSILEAGNRTGILSLINLMPLFFGPHLDFLAGLMGVSLHNMHTVHGSAAVVSVLLSAAHAIFSVLDGKWKTLAWSSHVCGLIVSPIHHLVPSYT